MIIANSSGSGSGYLILSGAGTTADMQVAQTATYQVLVSAATSMSLYSRLATTDPGPNALYLKGAIINQDVNRTLDGDSVTMNWRPCHQ